MDDTGCLDKVIQHQNIVLFNQTKCQYEKIKIIQSWTSLDDIIQRQGKQISTKNEGKQ